MSQSSNRCRLHPQSAVSAPELLIEMVAAGGDVATILPSWIAAPYLQTHDVASVQVGATPQARDVVLRNPSRCTARDHHGVRLGADRATCHAASAIAMSVD